MPSNLLLSFLTPVLTLGQNRPDAASDPMMWVSIVIAVVFAVAVVGLSFLSSKRSHQD